MREGYTMTTEQYLKNLQTPDHPVDVVLDTDACAEIDDQFAISYLLRSNDRLRVKGFCAAPYQGADPTGTAMLKSYAEIKKILTLAGRTDLLDRVYHGSDRYLPDEKTPVQSDAAAFLAELAGHYTADDPLYVVGIGAAPNIASALLLNPEMKEKTVVIWLGGNAHHYSHTAEYNMMQDVAAARIIFGCGVPFVQLPCRGVVDSFSTSRYELEHWLKGKNPLCDYLVENTIQTAERYAAGKPWTRVIWDVTTIGWLLNDGQRFMTDELRPAPVPTYDHHYGFDGNRHLMKYVTAINRDALFQDLFSKLVKKNEDL